MLIIGTTIGIYLIIVLSINLFLIQQPISFFSTCQYRWRFYQSHLTRSKQIAILLFLFRLCILFIQVIYLFIYFYFHFQLYELNYYSIWNLIFIVGLYGFWIVFSLLGLSPACFPIIAYSKNYDLLKRIIFLCYEIIPPNSMFITFIIFMDFDGTKNQLQLSFFHTIMHLLITLIFLCEYFINNIVKIRFQHVIIYELIPLVYLLFQWSLRLIYSKYMYPYPFMPTTSLTNIGSYFLVYLFHFVCYLLWYVMHRIKYYFLEYAPYYDNSLFLYDCSQQASAPPLIFSNSNNHFSNEVNVAYIQDI